MATTLYIRGRDGALGPYNAAQLRAAAAKGQLSPKHQLSADGQTWFPAAKIWAQLQPSVETPKSEVAAVAPAAPVVDMPSFSSPDHGAKVAATTGGANFDAARMLVDLGSSCQMMSAARMALSAAALGCLAFSYFAITPLEGDAEALAGFFGMLTGVIVVVVVAGQALFLGWFRSAYDVVRRRNLKGFTHSLGAAVGTYFVPVLTWITSYTAIKELSQAAAARSPEWRTVKPVASPAVWIGFRVVATLLLLGGAILFYLAGQEHEKSTARPPGGSRNAPQMTPFARSQQRQKAKDMTANAGMVLAASAATYALALGYAAFLTGKVQASLKQTRDAEPAPSAGA